MRENFFLHRLNNIRTWVYFTVAVVSFPQLVVADTGMLARSCRGPACLASMFFSQE